MFSEFARFCCLKRVFFLVVIAILFGDTGSLIAYAQQVSDPYNWLEDSDSCETQTWLEEQHSHFKRYMQDNLYRTKLKERMKSLLNYQAYAIPIDVNDLYFYKQRSVNEEQFVLYVQQGIDGAPRVLIDPNLLGAGNPVSVAGFAPSPDGKWLAYGLAESGSDWTTWRIVDVASGEVHTDKLEKMKFVSVTWTSDSQAFFYTRFDRDGMSRVYYHLLGTFQDEDLLVYEHLEDPTIFLSPFLSSDQKYLMIDLVTGSSGPNAIYIRPLDKLQAPFRELLPFREGNSTYIGNEGSNFYFWTNCEAPLGKVIAFNIETGVQNDCIPEGSYPLTKVLWLSNFFVGCLSDNAVSRLVLYNRLGEQVREIPLPSKGTVVLSDSKEVDQGNDFFFSYTNFVQPPAIYHYNVIENELKVFKEPQLPFNPDDYQTTQVFYPSKDGTKIPLFIVHKKGLRLDGHQQTLLYGYGGFGISVFPYYNSLHMAWLESGGVFALANIRGGAEFGKQWHDGGKLHKKQNCFDDFIAAAEWLIDEGYTTPAKLAIRGASNGGLLAAVCLNQRPELFGAALVEVGVLDMLRFHLFTIGRFWMVEYGNPEHPEDFGNLSRYSPYHNIQKGIHYPPVLVTTGDHDDRVVPLHSYKYTAALQAAQNGMGTVLLRVGRNGGHGAGKSISQIIDEAADELAFLKHELR